MVEEQEEYCTFDSAVLAGILEVTREPSFFKFDGDINVLSSLQVRSV